MEDSNGANRMRRTLTIAIVNWNTQDHLRRCLDALREACTGFHAEVIVVDNASEDDSAEMVLRHFPEVRLLALTENVGFAEGNNIAIRASESDHVLLLNPDIRVPRDGLRCVLDFLKARPEAAAVAAMMVGPDEKPQTLYYRRFPSIAQVALFYTILALVTMRVAALRRRVFEHDLRGTEPVEVDQLPGAFLLVRREVIEDVGLLDSEYFIWFEDVDWCYRMRRAGHRLFVLPSVHVRHDGGASFDAWSADRRLVQFRRSLFRFLCKFRLDRVMVWSRMIVATDLLVMEWLVRLWRLVPVAPRRKLPSPDAFRAARRAIRDEVRTRRGETPAPGATVSSSAAEPPDDQSW